MPIKVIIKRDTESNKIADVDLYFTKLFDIKIDVDEFIEKNLSALFKPDKMGIEEIKNMIQVYQPLKSTIATFTKMLNIDKFTLIIQTNGETNEEKTWEFVLSFVFFGFFQNYLHKYFKKVDNEYYNHQVTDRWNVNFEMIFSFRLIYLIFMLIKNYRELFKILKIFKGGNSTN